VICQYSGKRIFLPRILLCLSDGEMFPFQFKMKHIPIRLSFAMTVNKAQGRLSWMPAFTCLSRCSLMASYMRRYLGPPLYVASSQRDLFQPKLP
jgi:hypothetical protein